MKPHWNSQKMLSGYKKLKRGQRGKVLNSSTLTLQQCCPPPASSSKGEVRVWSLRSHATGQSLTPAENSQVQARHGIWLLYQELTLPGWLLWKLSQTPNLTPKPWFYNCRQPGVTSEDRKLRQTMTCRHDVLLQLTVPLFLEEKKLPDRLLPSL